LNILATVPKVISKPWYLQHMELSYLLIIILNSANQVIIKQNFEPNTFGLQVDL